MNLKKLSVIFSIILIIFASSINTSYAINTIAPPPINNEYIKSLEIIDNHMSILIKSIYIENFNKSQIDKDIKFIETLINDLTIRTSKLSEKDNEAILAMQIILDYYKISIINIKKFINSKDTDALMSATTSFSLGYNSSSVLRTIIGKASTC